ncbi:MAG TPA: SpaA isopeptide-forming pilin-related protein, partial [Marmoricola sp.]|nr:SpaA isopeptide-forming pilin-related protein [Marmoricola sp.]
TYHWDYTLTHTATTTGCGEENSFTNHAAVFGDSDLTPLDTDAATASICPNPGTWEVSKTSDVGDGAVPVDSDITYTLTAHKTGGVNPENVVVTDDLSDLAPYVDFPTFTAPDGSTVDFTDNVLTWTIDELGAEDATLTFTVHVKPTAYDADLPNLVTSEGSDNCPTVEEALAQDECTTDNDTPHYTLAKSSDAGDTVMPPYLGEPGTVITYTLTVHNDSDADITTGAEGTMPGAQVTDDLSMVTDDAHFVAGSIDPAGQATIEGDTLTWNLPDIPAGESRTLSYQFQVDADRWDQTLTNSATPGNGGECVEAADCTTTTDTPPATKMQIKKVDAETGAGLAGAEFELYQDNAPFADASDPVVGEEDENIGTATSGEAGIAQFAPWLLQGHFLVKETVVPEGYDLPVDGDTMAVTIGEGNFAAGTYMAAIEFRDPALGQITISKSQFERDPATGLWVPSDGTVEYGDDVRYVLSVEADGPKLFHDVTLTDYVPGFNPDDTTSTAKASLVDGSATCAGDFTCTVSVVDGLVTWDIGTVSDESGTAEMVIHFPDLPDTIPFDGNGEFNTTLWNVGYLDWDEAVFAPGQAPSMAHHQLTSNEVTVSATTQEFVSPPPPPPVPPKKPQGGPTPPEVLPNTGGPEAWLPLTGIGLVVLGAALVLTRERRRREA